jgi:hypothetical protein
MRYLIDGRLVEIQQVYTRYSLKTYDVIGRYTIPDDLFDLMGQFDGEVKKNQFCCGRNKIKMQLGDIEGVADLPFEIVTNGFYDAPKMPYDKNFICYFLGGRLVYTSPTMFVRSQREYNFDDLKFFMPTSRAIGYKVDGKFFYINDGTFVYVVPFVKAKNFLDGAFKNPEFDATDDFNEFLKMATTMKSDGLEIYVGNDMVNFTTSSSLRCTLPSNVGVCGMFTTANIPIVTSYEKIEVFTSEKTKREMLALKCPEYTLYQGLCNNDTKEGVEE